MIHPQIEALMAVEADDAPPSLEALRAAYLETGLERGGPREPVEEARDVVIPRDDDGSIPARVYVPLHGARHAGRLVWLHGGGWVLGDIEGFDHVCRALANAAGCEVVSVEYRLAPECPFPAGLDDARAAVRWAVGCGGPVVVGGDSAGGNLAAVALRHEREGVAAQVLVYPATDATLSGRSYADADERMLRRAEMEACWAAYGGGRPPDDPDLSPLHAGDLAGLPPTLVAVARHDVLCSDGEAYAAALRAAGVDVELAVYEDMTHGFLRWGGVVERAGELIAQIGDFTARRVATSTA